MSSIVGILLPQFRVASGRDDRHNTAEIGLSTGGYENVEHYRIQLRPQTQLRVEEVQEIGDTSIGQIDSPIVLSKDPRVMFI